jgi:hypothetical protein
MIIATVFVIGFLVACWLYVSMIARSRRNLDHLRDVPDDLRRADDNQQPPFDGSAGLW